MIDCTLKVCWYEARRFRTRCATKLISVHLSSKWEINFELNEYLFLFLSISSKWINNDKIRTCTDRFFLSQGYVFCRLYVLYHIYFSMSPFVSGNRQIHKNRSHKLCKEHMAPPVPFLAKLPSDKAVLQFHDYVSRWMQHLTVLSRHSTFAWSTLVVWDAENLECCSVMIEPGVALLTSCFFYLLCV